MNSDCRQFRDVALDGLGSSRPAEAIHAAHCEECAAWLVRVRKHVRALGELGRREAPAELFPLVAEGLRADSRTRIRRIVSSLGALEGPGAPAELDERVLTGFAAPIEGSILGSEGDPGAEASVPPGIRSLETLTRHAAPAVLDRLVAEELEKAEYHRVNRFTDLEKMRAPDALGRKLDRSLRPSLFTRRVGSWIGSLAAAGLVFWMALGLFRGQGSADGPRFDSRPFDVVSSESPEGFHPWLQSGIGVLAGPRPLASHEHAGTTEDVR